MNEVNRRDKELAAEVRVIVEVDGNPVGFLSLGVDRLWPLINHRIGEIAAAEWIDPKRYDAGLRAAVVHGIMSRLAGRLYQVLGEEIVKAELDAESYALRAEAAAQTFGRTHQDVEKTAADANRTTGEFFTFFWDYMLNDREIPDLKKEWKASV